MDPGSTRTLFINAHILCMDSSYSQHRDGFVLVEGASIAAVGPMEDCPPSADCAVIDCSGCALLPGLINCHTHLPMVYFRGMADDLPLADWLTKHIFPAEARYLSPQFVYRATLLAAAECIKSGTTCVNDMYIFEAEVARACAVAGLRAFVGEGMIGFPTASSADWQSGLQLTAALADEYHGHPLITPTVCVHAPYTCPPELLSAARDLSRERGLLYHIHLHETAAEPGQIAWRQPAETPTSALGRLGVLGEKFIGAHCVWLDDSDIALLAQHNCAVAHCPGSNLKLASGIMPLATMLQSGLAVGLGTDGAASNNNLSMLEEIALAALLQKGSIGDATAVPARTALALATREAARALSAPHIGSLEPGQRADLFVLDMQSTHLTPLFPHEDSLYSHIVYSAQAADVRDTMIEGRFVMRSRQLTTLDEVALREEAQDWVDQNYA